MGSEHSKARRCARITFLVVCGKKAPAFTVASLATIMHGTPSTLPMPATTPAAGIFPHCSVLLLGGPRAVFEERESFFNNRLGRLRKGGLFILRLPSWAGLPPTSRHPAPLLPFA